MTTKLPDTHPSAPAPVPLALKSNDGLGPLPEAMQDYPDHGEKTWREADMRAYALQERYAERRRVLATVEQRLLTWRQRTMNKSGDRLALDDFMSAGTIADLVDCVCDEWA